MLPSGRTDLVLSPTHHATLSIPDRKPWPRRSSPLWLHWPCAQHKLSPSPVMKWLPLPFFCKAQRVQILAQHPSQGSNITQDPNKPPGALSFLLTFLLNTLLFSPPHICWLSYLVTPVFLTFLSPSTCRLTCSPWIPRTHCMLGIGITAGQSKQCTHRSQYPVKNI